MPLLWPLAWLVVTDSCGNSNFAFMGGSMGAAVGEGIVRAAEVAVQSAALIAIPASGGARMQEGYGFIDSVATVCYYHSDG